MKQVLQCLLVATVCVLSPLSWADVPLPSDVSITTPTPDLRKELAAFSGKWVGNWSGKLDAIFIVERIDNAKADVIYAWGDAPAWNTKAAYGRFKAQVAADGKNQLAFQNASGTLKFTIAMNQDLTSINVQRTSPTATVSETFKKVGP